MELTLGPVLFEWKREEFFNFYNEAADMEVDTVHIGEVVCTKKFGPRPDDIARIAKRLEEAGKKVVLSSLAVVSNDDELACTRNLVAMGLPIEANDMSVLNMTDPSLREVYAGPHITTYNVPSVEFLKSIGVRRMIFPVELSRDAISHIIENTGVEGEVFAHGKVPLAFSWRCYTSRAFGLSKTGCRHHCGQYPDGLELKSLDGTPLFTANGTSLLSASVYTLVEHVEDLNSIGVKAVRVSPQYRNTSEIVSIFRKRIKGELGPDEGLTALREMGEGPFCNGWYLGGAGKDYITKPNL